MERLLPHLRLRRTVTRGQRGRLFLISYCQQPDCPGRRACKTCRNITSRATRTRHQDLTPAARARANCRSYANVYQRKGKLIPKPCEVCGSTVVEKHHDDYSKPLEVRWFCKAHHRELGSRRQAVDVTS